MTEVRTIPVPPELARVETGPLAIGDDWPGLFIRGDNAVGMVSMIIGLLSNALDHTPMSLQMFTLMSAMCKHCELLSQADQTGVSARWVLDFNFKLSRAAQLADVRPIGGIQ